MRRHVHRTIHRIVRRIVFASAIAGSLLCGDIAYGDTPTWNHHLDTSLRTASAEHRDVLAFFGDERTKAAQLMNGVVDDSLTARLALVEVAFPRDVERSAGEVHRHIALRHRYGIEQLPQIVLIDRHGRPYARMSPVGPDVRSRIKAAVENRIKRDAALDAAARLEGLDRARHLHAAMQHVGDYALPHYRPEVEAILTADPDNAAGLSGAYRERWTEMRIDEVIQSEVFPMIDQRRFAAARTRLEQLVEQLNPAVGQRQLLLGFIGQLQANDGDVTAGSATVRRAIALAPGTEAAQKLATVLANMSD